MYMNISIHTKNQKLLVSLSIRDKSDVLISTTFSVKSFCVLSHTILPCCKMNRYFRRHFGSSHFSSSHVSQTLHRFLVRTICDAEFPSLAAEWRWPWMEGSRGVEATSVASSVARPSRPRAGTQQLAREPGVPAPGVPAPKAQKFPALRMNPTQAASEAKLKVSRLERCISLLGSKDTAELKSLQAALDKAPAQTILPHPAKQVEDYCTRAA